MPNGLRISGGRRRELARDGDHPLNPLVGRREVPTNKRMKSAARWLGRAASEPT
jgi:hypothetical protein